MQFFVFIYLQIKISLFNVISRNFAVYIRALINLSDFFVSELQMQKVMVPGCQFIDLLVIEFNTTYLTIKACIVKIF